MTHQTGIPRQATGQAIVERAHGTLKRMLKKHFKTPQSKVAKAVYTLNHLTLPEQSQNPVILNNFLSL